MNFTFDKYVSTSEMISINNFDLTIGGKTLFKDTKLSLQHSTIYGLIGRNGCGKSSLLKQLYSIMTKQIEQSSNHSIHFNETAVQKTKVFWTDITSKQELCSCFNETLYVEQEIQLDQRNPLDFIFDSNIKLKNKMIELDKITQLLEEFEISYSFRELNERSQQLYTIINTWNPELEKANAIIILKGLGFTEKMLKEESTLLSGGWMMRLSLARALYLKPDMLLLDEPTNHLDLEAIIWLSNYLNTWNKTVIIVSHNIGFLNDICNYIINIEDTKLVYYKGNYNKFKECLENKTREIQKKNDRYIKQLGDIKKKGDKNKIIEFEKKNKCEKPDPFYNIYIMFEDTNIINGNIISVDNISYSYDCNPCNPGNLILKNISCGIDMDSRIVLVGINGSGKSTLIKLLMGELTPTKGHVNVNKIARIGYYNQHFESYLPHNMTPIEYIIKSIYEIDINTIRQQFGKIKLDKSCHNKLISELSGGQKARVALVKLILMAPHLLILDEPTNHLDIETVEALIDSLKCFEGGIIVITHESHLIKELNAKIWMLDNKTINYNIDSYDDYVDKLNVIDSV